MVMMFPSRMFHFRWLDHLLVLVLLLESAIDLDHENPRFSRNRSPHLRSTNGKRSVT